MLFQCKKYKGSVTPSQVRDSRKAIAGRAEKGIIIATGTFTAEPFFKLHKIVLSEVEAIEFAAPVPRIKIEERRGPVIAFQISS